MSKTEEWIARENIARFRQKLTATSSEQDRAKLRRLLSEEESKLRDAGQRRVRDPAAPASKDPSPEQG